MLFVSLAGCGMPEGVKRSLYTAELSLKATGRDATVKVVYPFAPQTNPETDADKIVRLGRAVECLTATIVQADKNLVQVIGWVEKSKEGLPNDSSGNN